MFRFAGFELDPQRAELRGPDGGAIKLRPKTFDMLQIFLANAGRIVDKRSLLDAVWPNVNVGDDSLFQCIRELRTALGDDRRQIIKLVSGRGYIFAVEVSRPIDVAAGLGAAPPIEAPNAKSPADAENAAAPAQSERSPTPCVSVMPLVATSGDPRGAALAAGVTDRLIDGLARIDAIRVVAPWPSIAGSLAASAHWSSSDFVVQGELQGGDHSWVLHARLIEARTGEVQSVATASVDINEPDAALQQTRLAAGIGHPLALHLNARQAVGGHDGGRNGASPTGAAKLVIEQALASNNQTTRERFAVAETMLENAIAGEPDNLDLKLALATLQLRGLQMGWYGAAERAAMESGIRSLLEHALRVKPNYIPVLDAYCRLLNTTNRFVDNLVACARTLSFNPWNGLALYHLGLAQLHLGRFEDALATFDQAYRFDTPAVSRWTWTLGAGWACVLLGRCEDALPWLHRSLATTSASGRTHMLLAAAYQQLGRTEEAKAALAKGQDLRPGSTARNVPRPRDNSSPVFVEASDRVIRHMVAAGLPEG